MHDRLFFPALTFAPALSLQVWARRFMAGHPLSHAALGVLLLSGRALAALVELWIIAAHARALVQHDVAVANAAARSRH